MKKKTLNNKLVIKVKKVAELSDNASAALKGGYATSPQPRCSYATCFTDPCNCFTDLCVQPNR